MRSRGGEWAGLCVGVDGAGGDDIAQGRLVLPFGEACRLPTPWEYRLAWSRKGQPSERLRRLIDWLVAEARASTRVSEAKSQA